MPGSLLLNVLISGGIADLSPICARGDNTRVFSGDNFLSHVELLPEDGAALKPVKQFGCGGTLLALVGSRRCQQE
jgi:hypothetical protein